MPKTDERQLQYAKKYHAGYDDIKIRVIQGERDILREYALSHGWDSLNQCVVNILDYAIQNGLTADDFKLRP